MRGVVSVEILDFPRQGVRDVVAFDGSLEMVKMASNLIGKDALHMLFADMNFSRASLMPFGLMHPYYMCLSRI